MSTDFDFNLLDHPWLPYVGTEGDLGTGSIRQVLEHAHEIRDLVVDVPTQYPALLRLLVAFLHKALANKNASPPSFPPTGRRWQTLYHGDRFPAEDIHRYADTWRDRFGLFDTRAPFFQVSADRLSAQQEKTVALLIPYASSGNNVPLFSARWDDSPEPLTPAQAARWLVHVHAWDIAGIKTGAKEDPQVKDGKTTGNRTGPLGELGVLVPVGETLRETLLYNLLVLDRDISSARDLPVWEREPLSAEWDTRVPAGVLERYTWPSRRVRLIPETDEDGAVLVRRSLVCAGDRIDPVLRPQRQEPHTAWLKNKETPQQKSGKAPRPLYRPRPHQPERELWRGLGGILGHYRTFDETPALTPEVLGQLAKRFRAEEEQPVLQLRAYGIAYGLQNAVIDETYYDTLPLPVALLLQGSSPEGDGPPEETSPREQEDRHDLGQKVVKCVVNTEEAARALGHLAADLAFAEGGDSDIEKAARERATRRYFADLDQRFRSWIAKTTDPDRVDEYSAEWHSIARRQARELKDELVAGTGPGALRTRTRKEKNKNGEHITVNLVSAQKTFDRRLRYHLGPGEA